MAGCADLFPAGWPLQQKPLCSLPCFLGSFSVACGDCGGHRPAGDDFDSWTGTRSGVGGEWIYLDYIYNIVFEFGYYIDV